MRFGTILITFCLAGSTQAQTDIYVQTNTVRESKVVVDVDGQAVGIGGWSRDTLHLKIVVKGKQVDPNSKKGRQALKEAGVDGEDETELKDLDRLISNMIPAFNELSAGDSLQRALDHEQALWEKARTIHCGTQSTQATPAEQRQVIACRKWAATCRLEDLLALYDSLNK